MKLACVDSIVPGQTLTEKAQNLKRWGFDGIIYYPAVEDWNKSLEREMTSLHKETGIHVCEFAFSGELPGQLMSPDSEKSKRALEMDKEIIRLCALTGAWPVMLYEFGLRTDVPSFQVSPYPQIPERARVKFIAIIQELCTYAEKFGLSVLLEAANRYEATYVNRQETAMELIRDSGCRNAGLLCDLFHMSMEEENLIATLRKCKGFVKHIHAGDTNRRVPGYGYMDWADVIQTLHEINYAGYIALECSLPGPAEECLPVCATMLRRLIDG